MSNIGLDRADGAKIIFFGIGAKGPGKRRDLDRIAHGRRRAVQHSTYWMVSGLIPAIAMASEDTSACPFTPGAE